ncbi:hypothetical protein ACOJQI_10760 [Bacillus salacetis]|uniref:hypothetical protein n=1 Tax=Bacillus salacetis TaxID=2315464 RepID=UPI003BA12269
MKKALIVILTILIEAGLLWLVSIFFGWNFMDVIFIGGLLIFGGIWLYLLFTNQNNNGFNASVKGWTGQDAGEVKIFRFKVSPVILGIILFMGISFGMTIFYYSAYFF